MKVTLTTIAEDTGYSVSTVSRVLSNYSKISSKTRETVLKSARRLNYPIPYENRVDLGRDQLNFILLTSFHEGEFYASFFCGYLRSIASRRIRLSLLSVAEPETQTTATIEKLIEEGNCDGIILFMPELDHQHYQELAGVVPDNFPLVSNGLIENPVFTTITFDGYSGGYQAAMHFEELGYQDLGIVKGPSHKPETRFRYNGFRDYIESREHLNLVWEYDNGSFEFDSGQPAVADMLTQPRRPQAVFVSNDLMALSFLEAAKASGLLIPDDIALIGYDDLPLCKQVTPNISTIRTDFQRLGTESLEALEQMLRRKKKQRGMMSFVPVSLVPRASSVLKLPAEPM